MNVHGVVICTCDWWSFGLAAPIHAKVFRATMCFLHGVITFWAETGIGIVFRSRSAGISIWLSRRHYRGSVRSSTTSGHRRISNRSIRNRTARTWDRAGIHRGVRCASTSCCALILPSRPMTCAGSRLILAVRVQTRSFRFFSGLHLTPIRRAKVPIA